MFSIAIQTLGCKLNQLESEAVASAFRTEGFEVLPWGEAAVNTAAVNTAVKTEADILVVNTCTVTSRAERKARRLIRLALRKRPYACVLVTGCYAQLDGPALEALGQDVCGTSFSDRFFVLRGDLKSALLDLPRFLRTAGDAAAPAGEELPALLRRWTADRQMPPPEDRFRFAADAFSFHSRSFLKIQDGCDHACAYCRVPLARGPSMSLAAEIVLARLRALEERGFAEAVLTGVNIGQYRGQYRDGALDLAGLLRLLLEGTDAIAIRLSSLEPDGVSASLLDVLGAERIRPHFHLSVQSGSPRILEKMRRPYGPDDIERIAEQLRSVKEDPFLACDMIAGFPGESPVDFELSRELCRRLGFAWIHAFPYSRRPGTEAAAFTGEISEAEASSRVNTLLALARRNRKDYAARWLGKTVEAIIETGGSRPEYTAAVSGNYLKLLVSRPLGVELPPPGRALRCRLLPLAGVLAKERRFDALAEPSLI
ncbi:MAG: tRNA (N(6)-L-threonylcarbamoyladenosine(37)-C(2))-methylthiotransferase MtaB [Treponema sp.]|jgi:threonylcarbamoyladenosine tRNA methylthiotransferase MtaB|nr:tRNA (N(6)-L-threonylcarbamoyladenosine(37)-C(2))-methylthiotransferase MtaB [Treponema sp.]